MSVLTFNKENKLGGYCSSVGGLNLGLRGIQDEQCGMGWRRQNPIMQGL